MKKKKSKGDVLQFQVWRDGTGHVIGKTSGKIFLSGPLLAVVKELWRWQCEHDGIDPNNKFAVFSKDNPITPLFNRAIIAHSISVQNRK